MSISLTAIAEPGFLRVVAAGPFSLDEAKRSFLEIIGLVEQYGVGKVLVDRRNLRHSQNT